MARKQSRLSRRMLFTWFMLIALIFFLAPENVTNQFQFAFARFFRWPLTIGRSISLSVPVRQPVADFVSRRQYNQLQNHLANIIQQLNLLQREVKDLSQMRIRLPLEGASLVPGQVIRASPFGSQSGLIINRGRSDGLEKGQFVLADNSIIGTICDVGGREAYVRLFTDPASRIEVTLARLDIHRVMAGNGSNSAKIPMVPTGHKIKVGDKVFARRKPGLLDAPIIIGIVAERREDDQEPSVWDITVKPACDFEKLEDVDVIIMNP